MNRRNQPLKFSATFYDLDGLIDITSTVTISIENPVGDVVYTGTVLPTGSRYEYELDDSLVDQYGIYVAYFFTDDLNLIPQVAEDIQVVSALADMLDAAVSSRLASGLYISPPTVAQIRAELDANSTKLDVAISTRLASAGYTTPPNSAAIQAAADAALEAQGYTSARAVLLDNLDAPVSGAATPGDLPTPLTSLETKAIVDTALTDYDAVVPADLPDPLTSAETIAAVQSGLTGQGYTTTRAGYLDTLNGLIANLWSAAERTLTDYDQEAILESLSIIEGVVNVLNGRMTTGELTVHEPLLIGKQEITIVQGDDYRYSDGRYFEWQFAENQCPDLTGGSVVLKVKNLRTGTVLLSKAGTIPAARTVRFELTTTETAAIAADAYAFEVSVTLANTHIVTLIPLYEGKMFVRAQA